MVAVALVSNLFLVTILGLLMTTPLTAVVASEQAETADGPAGGLKYKSGRSRRVRTALGPAPPTDNGKRCYVFHHMNKSGGTTVKFLLKNYIRDEGYTVAQYDTQEWLQGDAFAKKFMEEDHDFIWGSYTEGLRRHGAGSCSWFTIFRHPVARLVSAYFYCQKPERTQDPLCASIIRRADTMDLLTFAKHWGNFGMRQYVTSFMLPEDIVNSAAVSHLRPEVPGWYKIKTHLDSLVKTVDEDSGMDAALYKFLPRAQNLLKNRYRAVGILEEFNTTLHLFNRALQLPNYDWIEQYDRVGAVNVNNKDVEVVVTDEDRALEMAMTSADIKRYLTLDLLLYEQAVSIHYVQAVQYGLVEG